MKIYCAQVHDYLMCFVHTSEQQNVLKVTQNVSCKYKAYEFQPLGVSGHRFGRRNHFGGRKFNSQPCARACFLVNWSHEKYANTYQRLKGSVDGYQWQNTKYRSYQPIWKLAYDIDASILWLGLLYTQGVVLDLKDAVPGVGISNFET